MKPSDAGDYTFVPDGYALSLSAKLNFLGEEKPPRFLGGRSFRSLTHFFAFYFSEIKIDYVPRQGETSLNVVKAQRA